MIGSIDAASAVVVVKGGRTLKSHRWTNILKKQITRPRARLRSKLRSDISASLPLFKGKTYVGLGRSPPRFIGDVVRGTQRACHPTPVGLCFRSILRDFCKSERDTRTDPRTSRPYRKSTPITYTDSGVRFTGADNFLNALLQPTATLGDPLTGDPHDHISNGDPPPAS